MAQVDHDLKIYTQAFQEVDGFETLAVTVMDIILHKYKHVHTAQSYEHFYIITRPLIHWTLIVLQPLQHYMDITQMGQ